MVGKLYGVGVGPGPLEYLTLRAVEVLRTVDVIFTVIGPQSKKSVSRKIVEELGGVKGEICALSFSMSRDITVRQEAIERNAIEIETRLLSGQSCAFATIGDPMIYSTFGYVMKLIEQRHPEISIEVIPGITSFAALAARSRSILVEDREELRIIPGFDEEEVADMEFQPGTTTAVMKLYRNREQLLDRIECEEQFEILYGARLGLDEEKVAYDMSEVRTLPLEYLSMLVVKR